RQLYVGVNTRLLDKEKRQQLIEKETLFIKLILGAYKAEEVMGFTHFVGKKNNNLVAVGPIDLPIGRDFIESMLVEAIENQITKIDILAFEFEMGLFPRI